MESRNPVFANSKAFSGGGNATLDPTPEQLQDMYDAPAATPVQTQRMTIDDVIMKTAALFGVLLVGAAIGWVVADDAPSVPFLAMLIGLVLGLVISFKQSTSPALILGYGVVEGVFVGGISSILEKQYDNIVSQAVLGTLAAFTAMLVLYRTGRLRATPKFTKMFIVAIGGYFIVALVSLVAALFGVGGGWGFYGAGGLGVLLCVAGVALASLSLILDFDYIDKGIQQGLPERYSWLAAFGLIVSLIWLYIELLRLLAILRGDS
jgi:uncharacterized YccA/Bax inhibitor family protein